MCWTPLYAKQTTQIT